MWSCLIFLLDRRQGGGTPGCHPVQVFPADLSPFSTFMIFAAQRNQPTIVKSRRLVFFQWNNVMHLNAAAVDYALFQTHAAEEEITLPDFKAFARPSACAAQVLLGCVLFAASRFLWTQIASRMNPAAVFAGSQHGGFPLCHQPAEILPVISPRIIWTV